MTIPSVLSPENILGSAVTAEVDFSTNFTNIITVDKVGGNGKYTSIKAAILASTPTSTNPTLIEVYPGLYIEEEITLKPYLKLLGVGGELVTTIRGTDPTKNVINAVNSSSMDGFTITLASLAKGLHFISASNSPAAPFTGNNLRFYGSQVDMHLEGGSFVTYSRLYNIYFVSYDAATVTHLKITNAGSGEMSTLFSTLGVTNVAVSNATGLSEAILIDGEYNEVTFGNLSVQSIGGANAFGDGLVIKNGAIVRCVAGIINKYKNNIVIAAGGVAPIANIAVSLSSNATTYDVSVENAAATGMFTGSASKDKVYIADGSAMAINYIDTDVDPGAVLVGKVYFGPDNAKATNFTPLFNEALSVGLLSGGVARQAVTGDMPVTIPVTDPALYINITAGYGYVEVAAIPPAAAYLTYVSWDAQNLLLPDNSVVYVYVDDDGILNSNVTVPAELQNILLAKVQVVSGVIRGYTIIPHRMDRISSRLNTSIKDSIGFVFKTGSAVTEHATKFELIVGTGNYYYGDLNFLPTGSSRLSFNTWLYTSANVWVESAPGTLVNSTQYNDITKANGLTSLTGTWYTKHTLYTSGQGVYEQYQLVLGQTQYATSGEVIAAPNTTPPTIFTDSLVPIANIIIEEGHPNIFQIIDIRPRIGFQNPSTSAATIHGNLLSLTADDHTQYIRVDGTRAFTGHQSFGTKNLTSVGTVNGVTVENHDARHLPEGTDALTTAAPLVNVSNTSTNVVGSALSFARSDHNHAVTGFATGSGSANGTNTGDQVADGESITGTGTALDPFVAIGGGANQVLVHVVEGNVGAIAKGQPVYVIGAASELPKVTLASAAVDGVLGVANTDITKNSDGYIVAYGFLNDTGVDTRTTNLTLNPLAETWVAGEKLYLSAIAGGFTKVIPITGITAQVGFSIKGNSATDHLLIVPVEISRTIGGKVAEDIILRPGDALGTNKVSIRNNLNAEVASINTLGTIAGLNISGTNTGDNATNSQYSSLVTNANHTGEVTGSAALTITAKAVTLAKMADLAPNIIIGRVTNSTGVPEALSAANVRTIINVADGANVGVVPNVGITGATKTKIAYDAKGLVTSGADATTADIEIGRAHV